MTNPIIVIVNDKPFNAIPILNHYSYPKLSCPQPQPF